MIKGSNPSGLSRAQMRTLVEVGAVMDAHERRLEHLLNSTNAVDGGVADTVVACTGSPGDLPGQLSLPSMAKTVRQLASGGPVYGIPRQRMDPDGEVVISPLPSAMFQRMSAGNPTVVFGHPPILKDGDRHRRVLGFYVHGVSRGDRTPCAAETPRSDLGLLFLCVELGARVGISEEELVHVIVPRTFDQFTIDQAVQRTVGYYGGNALFLTNLAAIAVGAFLADCRTAEHREPDASNRSTPR